MISRRKGSSCLGIIIVASMIVILLMSCFFTIFLLANFRADPTPDGDDVEGLQNFKFTHHEATSVVAKEEKAGVIEEEEEEVLTVVQQEEQSSGGKQQNMGEEKKEPGKEISNPEPEKQRRNKGNINKAFERKSKSNKEEQEKKTPPLEENRPLRSGAIVATDEETGNEQSTNKQGVDRQKQVVVKAAKKKNQKDQQEETPDIPRNGDNGTATLTIFTLPNCKGEKLVFAQNNKELLCSSCIDFCGKTFPNQAEGLEAKSILLQGENVMVTLHQHCAGTWKYPNLGFHSFVFEGCQDTISPAHAIFHTLPAAIGAIDAASTPKMGRFPKSAVFGFMKYYERFPLSPDAFSYDRSKSPPRYVTFNIDCGGWNNIRMGFEHAVLMAWTTNRTLVMPPPTPFYLIDFGPFAFQMPGTGHSYFGDFFNLDLLQQLPGGWISLSEFYRREKDRFNIPSRFDKYARDDATWPQDGDKDWIKWLGQTFGNVPAGPDHNVVMEPDPKTYLASENSNPRSYGTKKQMVLNETVAVLHFPACSKPHEDFRYLGQISTSVLYADVEREKAFHRFWRAAVVYADDIFKVAAAVVAEMGLFNYTSLHVRRNELQYADSFQDSASTLRNIDILLYPNELIYLATDETKDPHFFDALKSKHPIVTWRDFYDEKTGTLKFNGMPVRRKVINCIEQVICAGGRRFFGTLHSTFSSYIFRLRGYVGAPDTEQRHHNVRYTGLPNIDSMSNEPMDGYTYMKEDPRMWEVV